MRDFKKFTAKRLIAELSEINESRKEWLLRMLAEAGRDLKQIRNYKISQDGNHPEILLTPAFMDQKLDYLHDNPLIAGIVDQSWEYKHSSVRDYSTEGNKGLLKVEFIS